MYEFEEINNKLKDIVSKEIGNKKVFDKDIANALEINQKSFATMKARNRVPYEQIMEFCAKRKISINWIFYGQDPNMLIEETDRFVKIKYFNDVNASAGGGAYNYEEDFQYLYVDKSSINDLQYNYLLNNLEAINVIGDSMEPTFKDSDIVILDKTKIEISKNDVFVIAIDDEIYIKRLSLKSNGDVEIISDNKMYEVNIVKNRNIKIIGKVVGKTTK